MPWGPPICALRASGRAHPSTALVGGLTSSSERAEQQAAPFPRSADPRLRRWYRLRLADATGAHDVGMAATARLPGRNARCERRPRQVRAAEDQVHGWPTPQAEADATKPCRPGREPDPCLEGLGDAERRGITSGSWTGPRCTDGGDPWEAAVTTDCYDGRTRRVGAGVQPLAHGIPGRVGKLRGFGNAIVPVVAAVFVRAFMECRP